MAKKAKKYGSVVGIDIGSQNIKVAEIASRGREYVINALGIAPTPEGLVDQNGVYDTDTIGAVVKDLCQKSGVSVSNAVVSIAGQAAILVRTLEVPKMSESELKQHMEWEISRNQPFAELTAQSDYAAFEPTDPNAQNMDVIMAIAAQSAVDTIMGIGKKGGKQVVAIDVEPLAVARTLATEFSELGNETICVIDIGHKSTSINVYRSGQLLLPRQVPTGGEAVTQAIAGSLGVSVEEAEAIKLNEGEIPATAGADSFAPANPFMGGETQEFQPYNPFAEEEPAPPAAEPAMSAPADAENPFAVPVDASAADDPYGAAPTFSPFESAEPAPGAFDENGMPIDPAEHAVPVPAEGAPVPDAPSNRVYNAMARELDEFVAEVRRSIDYFRSKGGDVNRIFLAGGGAKLKGLDSFVSRALGVPCEKLDPTKSLAMTGKRLDMTMVEAHRPDFLIAIGNGLHIAFD